MYARPSGLPNVLLQGGHRQGYRWKPYVAAVVEEPEFDGYLLVIHIVAKPDLSPLMVVENPNI